jgi:hypothetical protein
MNATQYNLTDIFGAQRDSYAKKQGDFILADTVNLIGDHGEAWDFMRAIGGRMVRIVYECKDGTRRDMIGRQGVYASEQDGELKGTGHAMASASLLTLSFHTHVFGGRKVNTGSGKGYRTIRAAGILAIRVDGIDILTKQGQAELLDSL